MAFARKGDTESKIELRDFLARKQVPLLCAGIAVCMTTLAVVAAVVALQCRQAALLAVLSLAAALISLLWLMRENRRLECRAAQDSATQLLNKAETERLVKKAIDSAAAGRGVMFVVDINGLGRINNTYGHYAGDLTILQVARLLQELLPSEIVGRVGGDEFLVYARLMDAQTAELVARTLVATLASRPNSWLKCERTAVSVGLAALRSDNASFSALYQEADCAMYCAKNGHDAAYALYTPEMKPLRDEAACAL